MHKFDVVPDNRADSIAEAQVQIKAILEEHAESATTVVVIRGETPGIEMIAGLLAIQIDGAEWREGVWVRKPEILGPDLTTALFGQQSMEECCAVAWRGEGDKEPIRSDATPEELIAVFEKIEGGRQ